jgi:hypothetical protein
MASTCPGGIAGAACHVLPYIPVVGGYFDVGKKAVPAAVGALGQSVLGQVAQAMASAADGLLKTLTSFWMNIDTPSLEGADSPVVAIERQTGWITTCVAVVCILVAAARMAIRRRGEPGTAMMLGLLRLVVVSAAGTFLIETAGKLADSFSADLMSTAHLGANGWSGLISTTALSAAFASGDGMLLIVALLLIISSLIQLMLMVLRVGLLIILTGTLPLTAAASMSDWGESWWRKHLAWLSAWLLYKPAAALLYASAFALTHGQRSLVEVMAGFMLLLLSVLMLPALLKVIVPMTAHLGAASGGSLAMGVTGALATGAIKVAAMAGSGGAAAAAPSGNSLPAGSTSPASPPGSAQQASAQTTGAASPAGASTGTGGEEAVPGAGQAPGAGVEAAAATGSAGEASNRDTGRLGGQPPRASRPDGEQRSPAPRAQSAQPPGESGAQRASGAGAANADTGTAGNAATGHGGGPQAPLPSGANEPRGSESPSGTDRSAGAGGSAEPDGPSGIGGPSGMGGPTGAAGPTEAGRDDRTQEDGG